LRRGAFDVSAEPLDLASPRWAELLQAHGSAEDIPRLLEALAMIEGERERAELWFGIWATLCPDGQVYSAAYAAVPHLLAITERKQLDERVAAMHVVAAVEVARHQPGAPAVPDDLVMAYALAIESLPLRVVQMTAAKWDAVSAQILAAALLVGKRQPALARAVLALDADSH
jgi:hypothetical protein